MLGRLRILVAPLAVAGVLTWALPASAATGGTVTRDTVAFTVGTGGVLHAQERIVYDFTAGGTGLERSFLTKIRDDDTRDRIFVVEHVTASSPDGGPTRVSVAQNGDHTVVTVGGGQSLTGAHTVVLGYDVRGALSAGELHWTAIGGWAVPVTSAQVSVEAPIPSSALNCFAGALSSSTSCNQYFTDHTHLQAQFVQQNMAPGDYLTTVVRYPQGTVAGQPIYQQRRTLTTMFAVNPLTVGALALVLALLVCGIALVYALHGRDARVVSKRAGEGDQAPADEPLNGVRPGQIGTLIDETVDAVDVTASIVDLAVRGYLLIEELPRETNGRLDWRLRRLDQPIADLYAYERLLLAALFDGRDAIRLSDLGGTFAGDLAKVRHALYDDVVRQGWFARRPDSVRSHWTTAGIAVTVLGVAGTVALALLTNLALIGLAVIVAGGALAYGGHFMPAKTTKGSTVLAHTVGFRAFLDRGDPSTVPDRERIAVFSRYLPYAIVFGAAQHWAGVIEDAGVRAVGADNLSWYEGPAEWDLSRFAESMRSFTLATNGAISSHRQFRNLN
jgi:Predicted membrane protein (DUF2207)